jgi:tetratricopeptide (TPR) repeat protein
VTTPWRGLGLGLAVVLCLWSCLAPLPVAAVERDASPRARFEQALTATRDGRLEEALDLWTRVVEESPRDGAAWSNRGNVRLLLGDPRGAIDDQARAMAVEPEALDPHLNRGTAEEALGLWSEAAADYRWILTREPLEAAALYNLGNVRGSEGDWETARACFTAAAEARPGLAMARSSAALAAFQLGETDTAAHDLRTLIRRHPLFADARAALTAVLWREGSRGEAESHWAAASGLDPRYRQEEWLLRIRRWPPRAVQALGEFLSLSA